jgi:hypothetical protein
MVSSSDRATGYFFILVATMSFGLSALAQQTQQKPQQSSKVVIIVYAGQEKAAVRIAAEAASLGFAPMKELAPSNMSDADLSRIADKRDAVGVIWVNADGSSVKVWVANEKNKNETALQEVAVPRADEQADALIAFKAVELLRAGLMTLPEYRQNTATVAPPPPPPTPVKTPPSPPAAPKQREPSSRLSAALQPAAIFGFGDLSPSFNNIGLSFYVRIASRVCVEAGGLIPTFPTKSEISGVTLKVLDGMVRGGLKFALVPPSRRAVPSLSVFGGGLILKVSGLADSTHAIDPTLYFVAAIGGSFSMSFAVTEIIRLRFEIEAGAALPTPVIRKDREEVASFGMPFVSVLLGVEVRLF